VPGISRGFPAMSPTQGNRHPSHLSEISLERRGKGGKKLAEEATRQTMLAEKLLTLSITYAT